MKNVPARLHLIRGLFGCCSLLEDRDNSVIIDTGMVGEMMLFRRKINQLGLKPESIKAILLTHGHLDHAGNLAKLQAWTGAKCYAHQAETLHVAGQYPYTGTARWCGRLEAAGRFLFRTKPGRIDEFIIDGQEMPFWGGLRVVHLPGHSAGHCGFYSPQHDLLFSGDVMASYFFSLHPPPAILNSCPELVPGSVAKIRELNPKWIFPCHLDFIDGALHHRRFDRLFPN